jgi:hypothetical protein
MHPAFVLADKQVGPGLNLVEADDGVEREVIALHDSNSPYIFGASITKFRWKVNILLDIAW